MAKKNFNAWELQNKVNEVDNKAEQTYVDEKVNTINTNINTINSSLEEKANKTDVDNLSNKSKSTVNYIKNRMVVYPYGYTPPLFLKLFKINNNIEIKDFNSEDLFTTDSSKKTYYVSKSGNNTNNGLTPETAFATLERAYIQTDVETICILEGEYYRYDKTAIQFPDKALKIKAYPEGAKVSIQNTGSGAVKDTVWTLEDGVYKTENAYTGWVFDTKNLDDYGNPTLYTQATSLTNCKASEGTWYKDTTYTYVHTISGYEPSNNKDIKLLIPSGDKMNTGINMLYFEGINFEFYNHFDFRSFGTLIFKNCKFGNSTTGNTFCATNGDLVVMDNCTATNSYADGFNYNNTDFIEINCISYANGLKRSEDTSNGSTSHNNCRGLRINGLYFDNKGPNVADVHNEGETNLQMCIGCTAYNSLASSASYKLDFQTTDKMWLDSCVAYTTPVSASATNGSIKIKDCILEKDKVGNVTEY